MSRLLARFLPLLFLMVTLSACDSGGGVEPNEKPSASFSFAPSAPRAGTEVSFANQSDDSDGQIESYSWDFDDDGDEDATSRNPKYTFPSQGNYVITLTVTDDAGATATTSESVTVEAQFNTVTVTSVSIEDIPFSTEQGEGWDASGGGGPDVYYFAIDQNDQQVSTATTYHDDTSPGDLPLTWSENFIVELGARYEMHLYDYDPTTDHDPMDAFWFNLEELVGSYPDSFLFELDDTAVRVDLAWEYDASAAVTANATGGGSSKMSGETASSPMSMQVLSPAVQ